MKSTSACGAVEGTHNVFDDKFTAIILAGSRSVEDPVASVFGEKYKALVPICGKPMIARVVEALLGSSCVRRIVIVFDCEESLFKSCPEFKSSEGDVEIEVINCSSSICSSVGNVIEKTGSEWPYLVTTADHALLTPEMVHNFCAGAMHNSDLAIGLVERKYLEEKHPGSKRTYLPFKDTQLSGANLFAFTNPNAVKALAFWKRIEQDRKKPWKLFAAFGWLNLFGLLLKRYTVDQAFVRASKRIDIEVRAVRLPFAEAAIDVDSPKDYVQVTEILENRTGAPMPA